MKLEHTPDRRNLIILADSEDRATLQDYFEDNGEEMPECEAIEILLANSELQWVNPADTGDLTDAPLVGIIGDEQREESGPYGAILTGGDEQGPRFAPILERWAFMSYAVRSFVTDLRENGKITFVS